MTVDWLDVITHVIVAAFLVCMVTALGLILHAPWIILLALAANSAGWPLREAWQRARKHPDPWSFDRHKRWEAYPPVIVGLLIGGAALWFV